MTTEASYKEIVSICMNFNIYLIFVDGLHCKKI